MAKLKKLHSFAFTVQEEQSSFFCMQVVQFFQGSFPAAYRINGSNALAFGVAVMKDAQDGLKNAIPIATATGAGYFGNFVNLWLTYPAPLGASQWTKFEWFDFNTSTWVEEPIIDLGCDFELIESATATILQDPAVWASYYFSAPYCNDEWQSGIPYDTVNVATAETALKVILRNQIGPLTITTNPGASAEIRIKNFFAQAGGNPTQWSTPDFIVFQSDNYV